VIDVLTWREAGATGAQYNDFNAKCSVFNAQEENMVRNSLSLFALLIAAACSRDVQQSESRSATSATNSDTMAPASLTNAFLIEHLGKSFTVEGVPVGSKANYGLNTIYGRISVDEVWDRELLVAARTIVVEGRLDKIEATMSPDDPFFLQGPFSPGRQVPAKFILRNTRIVRKP
jgi:hypothetical protein